MVDDPPVAGAELVGRDPGVFLQVGRHGDVGVGHGAVGGHRERLEHREDQIGLADGPALGELGHLGQVGVVAARRSAVDPRRDQVDLVLRQAHVVLVGAHAGIGAPRGHLARDDLRLDGARPGADVVVGDQRHRREVVRPVAGHAALVEDRRHVGGERRDPLRRLGTGRHRPQQQRRHAHAGRRLRYSHQSPSPGHAIPSGRPGTDNRRVAVTRSPSAVRRRGRRHDQVVFRHVRRQAPRARPRRAGCPPVSAPGGTFTPIAGTIL